MPEIVLEAQLGRAVGSTAARRLRREGMVPGTVYGHGTEPVSVAVEARELRNALSGEAGTNTLLSLQAGKKTYLTLARELQRHPVKGTVSHVDFVIVRRDEVISAEVPGDPGWRGNRGAARRRARRAAAVQPRGACPARRHPARRRARRLRVDDRQLAARGRPDAAPFGERRHRPRGHRGRRAAAAGRGRRGPRSGGGRGRGGRGRPGPAEASSEAPATSTDDEA